MDWKSLFKDLPDVSGIFLCAIGVAMILMPEVVNFLEGKRITRYFVAALSVVLGVAGVISGHIQRRDSDKDQAELSRQLGNLAQQGTIARSDVEKLQQQTEKPFQPIIQVPQPKLPPRISKGFLQTEVEFRESHIAPNSPLSLKIFLVNKGQEPISGVYYFTDVKLASATISPNAMHEYLLNNAKENQRGQVKSKRPGATVSVGQKPWKEAGFNQITEEQFKALKSNQLRLYVFTWARWERGAAELDDCVWLKVPDDNDVSRSDKLTWRDCIQPSLPQR